MAAIAADDAQPWPARVGATEPGDQALVTLIFVTPGLADRPDLHAAVARCDTPMIPVWVGGDWQTCAPDDLRNAAPYRLPDELDALRAVLADLGG